MAYQSSGGFTVTPEFSIGSILSRTISTLLQKPLLFFGLAAIVSVPSTMIDSLTVESSAGSAAYMYFNLFLSQVLQGMTAYAVFLALRDEDGSFGEILSHGLARLFALMAVALLSGLCILMGLILLIIPGIIVACVLAVTAQACVVEQLGALDSMNRSAALTKGYRLQIFGLYVVVGIIFFAIAFILAFVFNLVFPGDGSVIGLVLGGIGNVIAVAFDAVMCGIIYYDLRAVKEGVTLDSLANIFD